MKNFYQHPSFLFCLLTFFAFSCSPKYGAYFPAKQYESVPVKPAEEKLLASEVPGRLPETKAVSQEAVELLESIDDSEGRISTEEDHERGALEVVKKSDKNATMTKREELILDALQVRLQEMSRYEKKALKREIKQLAKAQKRESTRESTKELIPAKEVDNRIADAPETLMEVEEPSTNTLLLVILAVLIPPLAVGLHEGALNGTFWLNLVLTLIFYVPGLIHALIVILRE